MVRHLAALQVRGDITAGRLLPVLEYFNPDGAEEVLAVYVGQGSYRPPRVRAFLDFLTERVDIGVGAPTVFDNPRTPHIPLAEPFSHSQHTQHSLYRNCAELAAVI